MNRLCTKSGDQLRRLWIDSHDWRVDDTQIDLEQRYDLLDFTLLKDLVTAQVRQLREKKVSETALLDEDSTAYHVRDEATGQCCCRPQFQGDSYEHRGELLLRQLRMQNAQAELKELKRKFSKSERPK